VSAVTLLNTVLVNLSFLITKPTGITTYATNLLPQISCLNPTLLTPQTITNYTCYSVPANLNPDFGSQGHLRRLLWTQLQLPRIYQKLRSRLLFSPVPEAPLCSSCRYIVMVHDLIPLHFPKLFSPQVRTYYRHYIPQVLSQAQHILCNSTATARDLSKFFQISASKMTPTLLAHDASHFRSLDIPKSNYFLYIGRYDPYKNLHRLVAAFASLPNCHEYELWLAGSTDPRYTPLLKAEIAHLGITEQVKFLDYVPYCQLPSIINRGIALVFPSLWEGFGLPVLEAMACGTPVITSNLASLPEITGEAALLVDPYNTQEIAAAMQTIATDAGLRQHLSTLGLARASCFSWAETGIATVEVLSRYL